MTSQVIKLLNRDGKMANLIMDRMNEHNNIAHTQVEF